MLYALIVRPPRTLTGQPSQGNTGKMGYHDPEDITAQLLEGLSLSEGDDAAGNDAIMAEMLPRRGRSNALDSSGIKASRSGHGYGTSSVMGRSTEAQFPSIRRSRLGGRSRLVSFTRWGLSSSYSKLARHAMRRASNLRHGPNALVHRAPTSLNDVPVWIEQNLSKSGKFQEYKLDVLLDLEFGHARSDDERAGCALLTREARG